MSVVVILETLRRHLTNAGYIVYLMFLVLMAMLTGEMNASPSTLHSFTTLLAFVVGAQLIGPEFSSGTLQLIIARPVNRSTYLLSRVAGVVLSVWLVIWGTFVVDAGWRLLRHKPFIAWKALFGSTANVSADVLLVCALMCFFGSMTRSYMNAAIYFGLNFGFTVLHAGLNTVAMMHDGALGGIGSFLSAHPGLREGSIAIERNLFTEVPEAFDPRWLVMVCCNAAVLLLAACVFFRQREVPYDAE